MKVSFLNIDKTRKTRNDLLEEVKHEVDKKE